MTPTWQSDDGRVTLYCADCREAMASMAPDSVESIVCDPPYGLGFMGKGWDHGVPGMEFWTASMRVAKPGAHLLAFGGTRTFHRLASAIEDAGWEIRDTIMWVYGSGFPKSHNGPWGGTALKPAWEPIIMARKPLDGTVAQNVQQYGTGGINVDGCRIEAEPWQRIGLRDDMRGGNYRSGSGKKILIGNGIAESNPAGRWPANLVHDGSPEVLEGFPNAVHGAWPARRSGIGFHEHGRGTVGTRREASPGSAARFFYCAKASREDRNEGCEGLPAVRVGHYAQDEWSRQNMGGTPDADRRPVANHHPTVKPTALMRWIVRLVTPPGGMILDPFMGSGSTGKAAALEGFRFVGCDLSAEYVTIARARIERELSQPRLPMAEPATVSTQPELLEMTP